MNKCRLSDWVKPNNKNPSNALGKAVIIPASAERDLEEYVPIYADVGSSKRISIQKHNSDPNYVKIVLERNTNWNRDIRRFADNMKLELINPGKGTCYLESDSASLPDMTFGEDNDWKITNWRVDMFLSSTGTNAAGEIQFRKVFNDTIDWERYDENGNPIETARSMFMWPEY